ncbi:toll/interleukin-1 receptor domain-containing protein [Paenibacillus peoriae]|uniref:toll/interleukin-1 receptor domain-containing protein n=1 Tax=Paenibacillus peoriae TaxID=59893 RepID=UPI000CEC71A8|nr:toll/interleukin-1 receptor domain-containing protein [Paenibacillus peoriae]PPQ47382.1 toll/interleukin-1 receptor domain-containing protein [Paenibacillus peoriae]
MLYYGSSVFIKAGKFKGRVGYLDDDDFRDSGKHIGYVCMGNPLYANEYEISVKNLREVTIEDLLRRQGEIEQILFDIKYSKVKVKDEKTKTDLLTEFIFIESLFSDRYFKTRLLSNSNGRKVFISHSSKDKTIARLIATDLAEAGHNPWLDEWRIKVGESIPRSISIALKESEYVLVILSKNSVESRWVQEEWYSKYWDEIEAGMVKVVPILIEDCQIPELLKTKKYADFRGEYSRALRELLLGLN